MSDCNNLLNIGMEDFPILKERFINVNSKRLVTEVVRCLAKSMILSEDMPSTEAHRDYLDHTLEIELNTLVEENKISQVKTKVEILPITSLPYHTLAVTIHFKQRNCLNITKLYHEIAV